MKKNKPDMFRLLFLVGGTSKQVIKVISLCMLFRSIFSSFVVFYNMHAFQALERGAVRI